MVFCAGAAQFGNRWVGLFLPLAGDAIGSGPPFVKIYAFLSLFALGSVLSLFTGCSSGSKKGSADIYEGDGPNIHFHSAEAPGRAVKTHRYR